MSLILIYRVWMVDYFRAVTDFSFLELAKNKNKAAFDSNIILFIYSLMNFKTRKSKKTSKILN